MKASLGQRAVAGCLGTAFLLAGVVGSGIMAAKLASGIDALALLCNTLPTGAILTVLILTFGPVSGAHFNPAVSIALALRRELPPSVAAIYIAAQIVGGIVGVLAAHFMFELPLWQVSVTVRTGPGQWFAESVATFGLLLTIFGCGARTPSPLQRRPLHHGRLLVHRVNIVCQSRCDHRSRSFRYLRGHCPGWRACVHHRSDCRRTGRRCSCTLAVANGQVKGSSAIMRFSARPDFYFFLLRHAVTYATLFRRAGFLDFFRERGETLGRTPFDARPGFSGPTTPRNAVAV